MAAVEPLQRLAASLVVVRASGQLGDAQRRYPQWELSNAELQRLLAAGVGGVILLGGSATELRLRCAQLGRWGGQPLLLCADVEEGVGQRFPGASWAWGCCTAGIANGPSTWPSAMAAAPAGRREPWGSIGCWRRCAT